MIEDDNQLQITIDWIGNIVSNLTIQELPTTTNDKLRYGSYLTCVIGQMEELLDQVKVYWNNTPKVTINNWNINLDREQLVEIEKQIRLVDNGTST